MNDFFELLGEKNKDNKHVFQNMMTGYKKNKDDLDLDFFDELLIQDVDIELLCRIM